MLRTTFQVSRFLHFLRIHASGCFLSTCCLLIYFCGFFWFARTSQNFYLVDSKTLIWWNMINLIYVITVTIQFLMQWELDTEAVVRMCSIKKLFLEISKNLQEDTCPRVSFSAVFYKKVLLNIWHNSQEDTCVGVSFLIIKRDSVNSALVWIFYKYFL